MLAEVSAYADAIDHLPVGATLVVPNASWEQYEDLLHELGDRPGLSVSYDEGRLQVMSPSAEHEEYREFILSIARTLSEELGVPLETRGSTTWKRPALQKGVEADTCFYVAQAARIIGKRTIDLGVDPPPDVVVEIDMTSPSLDEFGIYAVLGVPEIWRYDGRHAQMFELRGERYSEVDGSRFFPGLSAAMLAEFLELSKTHGQTGALKLVRQRARTR
jgi:Uma2 family endonuclease